MNKRIIAHYFNEQMLCCIVNLASELGVRLETKTVSTHSTNAAADLSVSIPILKKHACIDKRKLAAGEQLSVPHEEDGGAVFVAPVLEEILVVAKRWVVREELRLHRTTHVQQVEQQVLVLRQQADIERLPPRGPQDPKLSHS